METMLHSVWVLVAGFLVFFMHKERAAFEAGRAA